MNEEKTKVLEQIQNEEITLAEGIKLLEALESAEKQAPEAPEAPEAPLVASEEKATKKAKTLRIRVSSADGDRVNVQIPLQFAKAMLKMSNGFLAKKVEPFGEVDLDMVIDMIEDGNIGKLVDIVSSNGDNVEIVID